MRKNAQLIMGIIGILCSLSSCKIYLDTIQKPHVKETEVEYIENVPATITSDDVYYEYDSVGNFKRGETKESSYKYNGKSILTVTAYGNGLEIVKYHDPIWWYVTIVVYNKSRGVTVAQLTTSENDNKDTDESGNPTADTYFYPFVEKGEDYKIYIVKQNKGYQEWASYESNAVEITAIGGDGNFYLTKSAYSFNHNSSVITFKDLTIVKPASVTYGISAGIYDGGSWSGESIWPSGFNLDDSSLSLIKVDDVKDFITGKNKIFVSMKLNYGYWNSNYDKYFSYEVELIEDVIYDSNNKSVVLSGGVQIPRVNITCSSANKNGSTYSMNKSGWNDASINIENCDVPLSETYVQIKERGNSTKGNGKMPYSLKFSEKTEVLGMKKSKRWVLMANFFDRSLIRTQFAGYLGNNIFNSYWNAQFEPVELYFNGDFIGIYDLGECNKISKQRVDVQSIEDYVNGSVDFIDVNGDGEINIEDAGFMVEIDTSTNWSGTLNKNNYKTDVGTNWSAAERIYFYSSEYCIPMTLKDPDFGDGNVYSDAVCQEVGLYAKSKIDAFEKMLKRNDFAKQYKKYIDVDSFVDWYLINEFAKNSDANFQKSVPVVYNPETGKLYMGPNWDFDLGFGNFSDTNCDDPKGWYIYGTQKYCAENSLYCEMNGTYVQSWWINRLMKCSSFRKAVKERWKSQKHFLKKSINETIIKYANRVSDYIPESEAHLPRLGQYSWNGPSGYATRKTYGSEIYYFYNWCISRYNWMDTHINSW